MIRPLRFAFSYFSLVILASMLFLCWNCNTPAEQKGVENTATIYADFYVRYLSDEQQLKGQVTFGEGDTINKTKAVEMTKVNFMNSGMNQKNVQNKFSRYIYQAPASEAKDLSKFVFTYIDKNGVNKEQIVEMQPVKSFGVKDGISKSKGMVLELSKEAAVLSADESLILLFSSTDNKVATLEVGGPSTNAASPFAAGQLNSLHLGKSKLYVVKKQNRRFQQANDQISTTVEFYSKTIDVEVLP